MPTVYVNEITKFRCKQKVTFPGQQSFFFTASGYN